VSRSDLGCLLSRLDVVKVALLAVDAHGQVPFAPGDARHAAERHNPDGRRVSDQPGHDQQAPRGDREVVGEDLLALLELDEAGDVIAVCEVWRDRLLGLVGGHRPSRVSGLLSAHAIRRVF
jgi:hypothetical protein